jgi:hypothetical protein
VPLVFVHGVAVREDTPGYEKNLRLRDALFRRFVLDANVSDPQGAKIFNPAWGKYGAQFRWNHASLPGGDVEALGAEDEAPILLLSETLVDATPNRDSVLLQVARASMRDAIDLLWTASAPGIDEEQKARDLADLAVRAVNYSRHNVHPGWIDRVNNDQQLLVELQQEVAGWRLRGDISAAHDTRDWEALGYDDVWDHIREGVYRIRHTLGSAVSRPLVELARPSVHRMVAGFLGDVFVYLGKRGNRDNPGPIVAEVIEGLEEARNQASLKDEKLVVVGHSMGGNILYDVLTHFRPDLYVDVLVAVGSQAALFEELKLFIQSDHGIPDDRTRKVPKPRNVGCWLNVFDRNDVLGFAVEGVFDGPSDFSYTTGRGLLTAHSAYFSRPSFHERLAERIRSMCQ